jgi:hypothetical protein
MLKKPKQIFRYGQGKVLGNLGQFNFFSNVFHRNMS